MIIAWCSGRFGDTECSGSRLNKKYTKNAFNVWHLTILQLAVVNDAASVKMIFRLILLLALILLLTILLRVILISLLL